MANKYALPDGYQENTVATTVDHVSGTNYWAPHRLVLSYLWQHAVYQYATTLIEKRNVKTLMDVGCGPAKKLELFASRFPSLRIIGIDQKHPIEFCKNNHPFGEWYVDDFENPSGELKDTKADLIICADVIEHIVEPEKLLAYIKMRLAQGGAVVLSTPDRDKLYGENCMKSGNPDHIREWNFKEFAQFIKNHGWVIHEHFHLNGLKPAWNKEYIKHMVKHFAFGRPYRLDNNQVVLITPIKDTK